MRPTRSCALPLALATRKEGRYRRKRGAEHAGCGKRGNRHAVAGFAQRSAIAAGRGDVFFEYLLSPWDYAAGSLLVEEAGGVIGTFDGSPLAFDHPCPVLAGNPETVAEVLQKDILRQNAGNAIYD